MKTITCVDTIVGIRLFFVNQNKLVEKKGDFRESPQFKKIFLMVLCGESLQGGEVVGFYDTEIRV